MFAGSASQQPGNFSPATSRIVCAVCNSPPGEPQLRLGRRGNLRIQRVRLLRPVSRREHLRGQLPQRAFLVLRAAPSRQMRAAYNPSRSKQTAVTSHGLRVATIRELLRTERSRYSAPDSDLAPLRLGHNLLNSASRSGAAGPGGLKSIRSSTLLFRSRNAKPHSMHRVSRCGFIGAEASRPDHHRPSTIIKEIRGRRNRCWPS